MNYEKITCKGPGGVEITMINDPTLGDKYKDVVICAEKLAAADAAIAKSGLPDAYYKDQERLKNLKKGNS